MPNPTPMTLTFYGQDDEVIKTFVRSFVPWKILKRAIKLEQSLKLDKNGNPIDLKPEDIDSISGLVVDVFGDQFTIEELDEHVDVSEMIAVLQTIIAKASGYSSTNPTPPVR